jgi:hypothetical protein
MIRWHLVHSWMSWVVVEKISRRKCGAAVETFDMFQGRRFISLRSIMAGTSRGKRPEN